MAKYIVLIGTKQGQWFEEEFEEISGKGIKERTEEIYLNGFKHTSSIGSVTVKPEDIVTVRTDRQ